MKKIIILLAMSVLLLTGCTKPAEIENNDANINVEKSNDTEASLTIEEDEKVTTCFPVKDIWESSEGSGEDEYEFECDENGNIIKISHLKRDNGGCWLKGYFEYEYDQNGYITKVNYYEYSTNADAYVVREYLEYNEDGNITISGLCTDYDTNELFVEGEYEYDKNGYLTKETHYEFGSIYYISEYEYDENGNLIKDKCTNYNDKMYDCSYSDVFEYDKNDSVIKKSSYDFNGSIDYYTIYEYDQNNSIIKATDYNADGSLSSYVEWSEDDTSITSKYVYSYNGSYFSNIYTSEFDENGNVIKDTYTCSDDGSYGISQYEYMQIDISRKCREFFDKNPFELVPFEN